MPRRLTRISIAGVGEIVGPPPVLTLLDDTRATPVSTGLLTIDVLANDTPASGIRLTAVHPAAPLTAAAISIIGSEPTQQVQINLAGLAAGTYSFTYDGQLIADPTVTATGNVTLTVQPVASVDAVADSATLVSGGTIDVNVLANDTSTGDKRITSVTPGSGLTASNLSIVGTAPNQIIRVNAVGVPAGSYSFNYRAELMLDATVFDIATVSLTVTTNATVDAQDDVATGSVGTGNLDLTVLNNDPASGDKRITQITANTPLQQSALSIQGTVPNQFVRLALNGLAAGTYSFTYRAELAADPAVFDTATCTVTLNSLSTATVRAISSDNRAEGDDTAANKTWFFGVARTGDLTLAASVNWALEGTLVASDMPSGQATSGNIAWAAGAGAEVQVVITVIGDAVEEPNETVTIRIKDPVGCVIGTATASLTITDDDTATTTPGADEYDQELGYGGMMLGFSVQDGQVGNQPVFDHRDNASVMYLESDYPIAAIQTENRYDKYPLSSRTQNTGYSDHTVAQDGNGYSDPPNSDWNQSNHPIVQQVQGGDIQWTIYKVTSADSATANITLGPALGSTARIPRCVLPASWNREYEDCGGELPVPAQIAGSGGSPFLMYPTIFFRDTTTNALKPVDVKAAGLKIGDRIAIVCTNSATDDYKGQDGNMANNCAPDRSGNNRWAGRSRWASVNFAYRDVRGNTGNNFQRSSYPLLKNAGMWQNKANDDRYLPNLLIGHKRPNGTMLVKGSHWAGYVGDDNYLLFSGADSGLRQLLYVPTGWTGRKIIACDASVFRNGTGTVRVALRKAGSDPDAGGDDGTLIDSATFTPLSASSPSTTPGEAHCRAAVSPAVTVTDGEVYIVEVTVASGSATFRVCQMLNYFDRAGSIGPLQAANNQDTRNLIQRRSGNGNWTNFTSAGRKIGIGVAIHFDVSL